ncbi:MAG: hypothetical protein AAGF97_10995 [Planctomycetota bacterium]
MTNRRACLFGTSLLCLSVTLLLAPEASAGRLAGAPGILGPGTPLGVPTAVTGAVNNDDYSGDGLSNPNLISFAGIEIAGLAPVDISIPVANTAGTTEYFLDIGLAVNLTGVDWGGFVVEIGSGVGANFVRSTSPFPGVSGLDFDFPVPDPVLSSPEFPTIDHQADVITFSGGTVLAGDNATGQAFAFDIPDIAGGTQYDFTVRLQPIPVPEPTTRVGLALATLFCIVGGRRRR